MSADGEATNGSQQAGDIVGGDGNAHAATWYSSATSNVDLQTYLPGGYVSSTAYGIDSAGRIVGVAYDANSVGSAVLWTPVAANLVWAGGLGGNAWDVNATKNWFDTGTGTRGLFSNLDNVTFTDAGAASGAVSLNSAVQPGSVTLTMTNASSAYSFSGSGGITGSTGLVMNGAGTFTIGTSNTYTGETDIHGGNVIVNSGGILGDTSGLSATYIGGPSASDSAAVAVHSGGTLSGSSIVLGSAPGSTGAATQNGGLVSTRNGALTIGGSGAGTYALSGGTIAAGALLLGAGSGGQGAFFLNGGVAQAAAVTTLAGTGNFYFNGGTLQASASNSNYFTATNSYIRPGAAVIDTNGYRITMSNSFVPDPAAIVDRRRRRLDQDRFGHFDLERHKHLPGRDEGRKRQIDRLFGQGDRRRRQFVCRSRRIALRAWRAAARQRCGSRDRTGTGDLGAAGGGHRLSAFTKVDPYAAANVGRNRLDGPQRLPRPARGSVRPAPVVPLVWFRQDCSHSCQRHEKRHRLQWRLHETARQVKLLGRFAQGMDQQCEDARVACDMYGAQHGVAQQGTAEPKIVITAINSQSSQ